MKIQLPDQETDVISIENIAKKYDIPEETALNVLSSDYGEHVVIGKLYLISKKKIDDIQKNLQGILKFTKACEVLETNKIPESSHADLLSKLGYDVVWTDLDPSNATIIQKNP